MTIRHQARRNELLRALEEFVAAYEAEHGEITGDEMAAARGRLRARSGPDRVRPYNMALDRRASTRSGGARIDDLFGVLHRSDVPPLTIEEINEGLPKALLRAACGARRASSYSASNGASADPCRDLGSFRAS